MAAKPSLLRELNQLPAEALKEVASFISHLKKCRDKKPPPTHNGKVLAGKQTAAIKKWAGRKLSNGFSGRAHNEILYGDKGGFLSTLARGSPLPCGAIQTTKPPWLGYRGTVIHS